MSRFQDEGKGRNTSKLWFVLGRVGLRFETNASRLLTNRIRRVRLDRLRASKSGLKIPSVPNRRWQRPAESTTQTRIGRDLRSSGALHRAIAADLDGSVDMNPMSGIRAHVACLWAGFVSRIIMMISLLFTPFEMRFFIPVRWVETVSKNPIARPAGYRIQDYLVRSIEAAFMFTLSG